MLAHLLVDDTQLDVEDTPLWSAPACLSADGSPASLLMHGRLFSLMMQGSALCTTSSSPTDTRLPASLHTRSPWRIIGNA